MSSQPKGRKGMRERETVNGDILYRIFYRIPIKSHSEAAQKRLGIERSKQNWLSRSIYCPMALPRPTIANANNREQYRANLSRMSGSLWSRLWSMSSSCIGISLRRVTVYWSIAPKFACSRSIYALRGGLYNYAMIEPEPFAGFIYLLVLWSVRIRFYTYVDRRFANTICPIYREALHACLLAFPRVILIKHLGFASPFNRPTLHAGIMRLNLAYANQ